ncbi:hypothetical protein BGZ74_008224, partial [Mortierella antarctica]
IFMGWRLAGVVLILGGSNIYTNARDKEMRVREADAIPMTVRDIVPEEGGVDDA